MITALFDAVPFVCWLELVRSSAEAEEMEAVATRCRDSPVVEFIVRELAQNESRRVRRVCVKRTEEEVLAMSQKDNKNR